MTSLDMRLESTQVRLMELDLEGYKRAQGISYAKLAARLGLTQGRHAMRWALGESWPDADKLQHIVQATGGEVTLEAMYRRRLAFLTSQTGVRVDAPSGESVTAELLPAEFELAARLIQRINPTAAPRIIAMLQTPTADNPSAPSSEAEPLPAEKADGPQARGDRGPRSCRAA